MPKERYVIQFILGELNDKMVFVGGPRQEGKTTFCRNFVAAHFENPAYFNWDNLAEMVSISSTPSVFGEIPLDRDFHQDALDRSTPLEGFPNRWPSKVQGS